jgi:hypothetical protein
MVIMEALKIFARGFSGGGVIPHREQRRITPCLGKIETVNEAALAHRMSS